MHRVGGTNGEGGFTRRTGRLCVCVCLSVVSTFQFSENCLSQCRKRQSSELIHERAFSNAQQSRGVGSLQGREGDLGPVVWLLVKRSSLVRRLRACQLRVAERRAPGVPCALTAFWRVARFALLSRLACSVVAGDGCRAQLFGQTRAWMASSSAGRGAARAPPPPDRLAVLYKLVDKKAIAGVLCRHARAVELAAEAATHAEALFADDSLVVAKLRMDGSMCLANIACEARGAEIETFARQSWALLLSAIPVLLRRLESNTLLPGSIREEELEYEAHNKVAAIKAKNEPLPRPAVLRAWESTMGYGTLLDAMVSGLHLLACRWWPATQSRSVESFVLQGLDVIPRTAGIPAGIIAGEEQLVMIVERYVTPLFCDPTFCTSVLRKWRSEAVSSVLRARGVLQTGIAKSEQSLAEFDARKRADIAMHGLRDCALPSCSKTEKTVKEFAGCSGCRTVVYCCVEHQALDWKAHKTACRETEAARLAEEEAGRTLGGGAAAG